MKKKVSKILFLSLMSCIGLFAVSSIAAEECVVLTWFGGAAGKKGKEVKGTMDSGNESLKYDWKNGEMKISFTANDGGRVNGASGTWKQDGSNGTFVLKGNLNDGAMKGTWSSAGSKAKNKLELKNCQ